MAPSANDFRALMMKYKGDPAYEISSGRPEAYYDYVQEIYGDAFRVGTSDGIETFCELYQQISMLGNTHSTELFVERFIPLLPTDARGKILNDVLNKPQQKPGQT